MKQAVPKRLAIIGLPGSGKSTFAAKVGRLLNIPVHHLDMHVFAGKRKRDRQEFLLAKEALVNGESWIIEGCSLSTLEMRFARADTILYFHLPRLLCIWRICKRLLAFDKSAADTGCLNGINWALIAYLWNFDRDKRSSIAELRKKYPAVEFRIFHRSRDVEKYLDELKRKKDDGPKKFQG